MRTTRRAFIGEIFRELSSPIVSGLRSLSSEANGTEKVASGNWRLLSTLAMLPPGEALEIEDKKISLVSDQQGIKAYATIGNVKTYLAIEIRNTNQVWVNLKEKWAQQDFLCHLTLQKKEE